MSQFDMYRTKKKKEVDPNAPPRPNLLSHEKKIKDLLEVIEQSEQKIRQLTQRVESLESKLFNQTTYLNQVHQILQRK